MIDVECPVIEVKKDIEQVMKQWKQIGDDYEEWLSNLDKLAGAQKVLIDKDKDFDELPLLTGEDNYQSSLLERMGRQPLSIALEAHEEAKDRCTNDVPDSLPPLGSHCAQNEKWVVANTRVPPPGFEGHTFRGGMYGAIGQRKVSSSNTFGEAHIKKQIMRRPSIPVESATSVAPWASARSECHVAVAHGYCGNTRSSNCDIIRLEEPFIPVRRTGCNEEFLPSLGRTVNMDSYECKICLNAIVSDERLLKCPNPGCNEPFHKECVIGWVKSDSTCPNCRGVWRDPMEFPTLSSTLP
ncbi:unnamed protein product [Toxocara canis]|uniref:RING-type domain-containing protein n=1 Tax=Toxocara canis TaxID=6265 RepID=A0A183TWI5_TOXCA|nr:unnamed protein product [Toxocara canis]